MNAYRKQIARRWFLQECGVGLGAMALSQLLGASENPLAPKKPHFPPKAKNVIFLFMAGAPSHLELFDYKPQLAKFDGTLPPADLLKGLSRGVHQSEFETAGAEVQVRQIRAERRGAIRAAAASGEGRGRHRHREIDGHRRVQPRAGPDSHEHRHAAVRPPEHGRVGHLRPGQRIAGPARVRGVQFGQEGAERRQFLLGQRVSCPRFIRACSSAAAAIRCLYLSNPPGVDQELQRDSLDEIRSLNQARLDATGDPEIATRINSFEMAFRMQDQRAGADGHFQGAEADAGDVRRRAGQTVVRQQLPAGAPAGGTRRAFRAALPRGLGPARRAGERYHPEL